MSREKYDVIVVGAGHAGVEAANISGRMGCKVLLVTIDIDAIGKLSCNPAVGGVAKSHLVREVDALGGLIAKITDQTALGYRILNRSRGRAVWATRAQVDRFEYPKSARRILENNKNIRILQAKVKNIPVKNNKVIGVESNFGEIFYGKTVIICAGTFLNSTIHIGLNSFSGGRIYEESSDSLFKSIKKLGFKTKHFKTGTCARLDKRTVNFSNTEEQRPDLNAKPFHFGSKELPRKQLNCYITYTNSRTHRIIRKNLKYSPLYTGKIKSKGVRYCPSLEDKIVKFSDKERHHVFIEPEGRDSVEVYPNGISTSLPFDVQREFIRTIRGLEKAVILRPGYGIEHGLIDSRQLNQTLESEFVEGLYFAGQVNGTTGYEEAAAQGIIAGINSALKVKKKSPFILRREDAFIGVLVDDLTKRGTDEPYRMFTSRSEFRLLLREDNAVFRLGKYAFKLGIISKDEFKEIEDKSERIDKEISGLKKFRVYPDKKTNRELVRLKTAPLDKVHSAFSLLKRPGVSYKDLKRLGCSLCLTEKDELEQVEIKVKYEGFIKKQSAQLEELRRLDRIKVPKSIHYKGIPGLSREIAEKLEKNRPRTLREAFDISGVTPAAILILINYLKSHRKKP